MAKRPKESAASRKARERQERAANADRFAQISELLQRDTDLVSRRFGTRTRTRGGMGGTVTGAI